MPKSPGVPQHVEMETKFDVDDSVGSPSFAGLSGVSRAESLPTQHLHATYFDTAGYDLAADWVTLRRRTGGTDAGWHLKLPAGQARTEIHAPLGPDDGAVPEALLDVVRAIVRDRLLVPVAHLATTREPTLLYGDDGVPVAEFCDDRVLARRINPADGSAAAEIHWREWELELADPGGKGSAEVLSRLTGRLHDAGARPAGHGSKLAKALGAAAPRRPEPPSDPVHRAVARQIAKLRECDRAVRADADDAVHQMRVTIRRIRSLLQASEGNFGITDDAAILSELRELATVLGGARDAEVLADRYRDALDALAPELVRGPVRERLVDGALRGYRAGLGRSLTAMRSPRYFRLLDALDAVVLAPPPPRKDRHPQADIASGYRRLRKRVKAADAAEGHARDEALHQVRKAAKRLRYVAAATGESAVAERAKAIQGLLGEHQDSVVSRDHLLEEAAAAHAAGEDTFTYGVLFAREADLGRRCRKRLGGALAALRRSVRESE